MPVRLLKPYNGQSANTLYWEMDQGTLRATGLADDQIELASDYAQGQRITTAATASTSRNATVYNMNSSSAQTLTLNLSGYWPVGTVLTVIQWGTGATTITPAAGVTVALGNGVTSLVAKGQNSVAQIIKSGTNSWIAIGGLGG